MPRTPERPMLLHDDPASYEPANLRTLTFEGGNPPGLEGLRAIAVPLDHCHGCTRPTAVEAHAFGLAQVLESRRTWPGEGRSAAARVAMVALPFLVGVVTVPGQVTKGYVLRLGLRLCPVCLAGCRGWRGQVRLTATEYAWHPWWEAAHTFDYATLIPPEMLHKWSRTLRLTMSERPLVTRWRLCQYPVTDHTGQVRCGARIVEPRLGVAGDRCWAHQGI
jgi:hypothetical protein